MQAWVVRGEGQLELVDFEGIPEAFRDLVNRKAMGRVVARIAER